MRTTATTRPVLLMLTGAVMLAVLAWIAAITVGWFLPPLLALAAVALTAVALLRARRSVQR